MFYNLTELHCIPSDRNLPGMQNEKDIKGESSSVRPRNYNTEAVAAAASLVTPHSSGGGAKAAALAKKSRCCETSRDDIVHPSGCNFPVDGCSNHLRLYFWRGIQIHKIFLQCTANGICIFPPFPQMLKSGVKQVLLPTDLGSAGQGLAPLLHRISILACVVGCPCPSSWVHRPGLARYTAP